MIPLDPNWRDTDAYFPPYASVGDDLDLSAGYLRQFLRTVIPSPPASVLQRMIGKEVYAVRAKPGHYDKVLLIGHSEGGVILRLVVLDALRQGLAVYGTTDSFDPGLRSICRADMYLFAPALSGARLAGKLGAAASVAGISAVVRAVRGYSPAMQEMQQDSQLLHSLRDDTNTFAQEHPELTGLRARIAWAHHDDIVTARAYRYDSSWRVLGTGHASVCKPRAGYMVPMEFLAEGGISDSTVAI